MILEALLTYCDVSCHKNVVLLQSVLLSHDTSFSEEHHSFFSTAVMITVR